MSPRRGGVDLTGVVVVLLSDVPAPDHPCVSPVTLSQSRWGCVFTGPLSSPFDPQSSLSPEVSARNFFRSVWCPEGTGVESDFLWVPLCS